MVSFFFVFHFGQSNSLVKQNIKNGWLVRIFFFFLFFNFGLGNSEVRGVDTLKLYFAAELKNVKVNLIILREYVGVLNAAL